jgi:hypothetical protein
VVIEKDLRKLWLSQTQSRVANSFFKSLGFDLSVQDCRGHAEDVVRKLHLSDKEVQLFYRVLHWVSNPQEAANIEDNNAKIHYVVNGK